MKNAAHGKVSRLEISLLSIKLGGGEIQLIEECSDLQKKNYSA